MKSDKKFKCPKCKRECDAWWDLITKYVCINPDCEWFGIERIDMR